MIRNYWRHFLFIFIISLFLQGTVVFAFEPLVANRAMALRVIDDQLAVSYSEGHHNTIIGNDIAIRPSVAVSQDGINWIRSEDRELLQSASGWGTGRLPQTKCQPDNPLICYHIAASEEHEAIIAHSYDGGAHWYVEFSLATNRSKFRQLAPGMPYVLGATDYAPRDLVFYSGPGEGYKPFISLGAAGVLTRDSSGNWVQTNANFDTRLMPSRANWYQFALTARVLRQHLTTLLGLLWLVGAVQTIYLIYRRPKMLRQRSDFIVYLLAIILPAAFSSACWLFYGFNYYYYANFSLLSYWALFLSYSGLIFTWYQLVRHDLSNDGLTLLKYFISLNLFNACLILLPRLLWAWGFLAEYAPANSLSTALAIFLLPLAVWQFVRKVYRTSSDPHLVGTK